MKLYNTIVYHSTPTMGMKEFEDVTTGSKAKTGEGAMVHGWGLYLQVDKEINKNRYLSRFLKYDDVKIKDDNNPYGKYADYSFIFKAIVNGKTLIGLNVDYEVNCDYIEYVTFDELDWFDDDNNLVYKKYDVRGEAMTFLYECHYDKDKACKILDDDIESLFNREELNTTYDFKTDNDWNRAIKWCEDLKVAIKNLPDDFTLEVIRLDDEWYIDVDDDKWIKQKTSGSQYTVEIPDDFVFLEENKSIGEILTDGNRAVFEGLSKSLWKIVDRSKITYEGWRNEIFNINGYSLYHTIITNLLSSEQRASWYLSEHNIKGIHYHGGTDGECYVVFDCEGLKIIEEE